MVIKILFPLFIFISIAAIFKAIDDSIKPDQFDYTIFKKWKGNKWLDLRIAYVNQYKIPKLLYPILIHFADAWHFCNSIIISSFFIGILYVIYHINNFIIIYQYVNLILLFFIFWLWFGVIFEIFYKLFRDEWLIKKFN